MNNRRPAFHVKKLFIYVYFREMNDFFIINSGFYNTSIPFLFQSLIILIKTLPALELSIINNLH